MTPPPPDRKAAQPPQPDQSAPAQNYRAEAPNHRAPAHNFRAHHARTERNLLLGFFALLFIVGGGLIWYFYGAGAAALGVGCIAGGAVLVGLLALLMAGLQWLSDRWEEK
jgi:hypothetical protein